MDKIKELLNDEIETRFKELNELDINSDEYAKTVKSLETLYKLRIEELKVEVDSEEKLNRRILDDKRHVKEMELKEKQLINDNKDRIKELNLKERQFNTDTELRIKEHCLKTNQFNEGLNANYLRMVIEVAGIVAPLVFYSSWMKKGFKFEETGAFTSSTFKNLIQKFKPTK